MCFKTAPEWIVLQDGPGRTTFSWTNLAHVSKVTVPDGRDGVLERSVNEFPFGDHLVSAKCERCG